MFVQERGGVTSIHHIKIISTDISDIIDLKYQTLVVWFPGV